MQKKYVKSSYAAQLKVRQSNSPLWNDLLKVREIYLKGRAMAVGNGEMTYFWRDPWCGSSTLKDKFSEIFDICNEQSCSVANRV